MLSTDRCVAGLPESRRRRTACPDDPAAHRSAELAALQGVAHQRSFLAGVEIAIAQKLENIAVQGVASRLGHDVDHAAGMKPYWAGRPSVCTLNSAIASGNGMGRFTLLKASLCRRHRAGIHAVGRPAGNRILARTGRS